LPFATSSIQHFNQSAPIFLGVTKYYIISGAVYLDGGIRECDYVLTKVLEDEFAFKEFWPVWAELPEHPLQMVS